MSTPNLSILRVIKMQYSGKELEYHLKAWDAYPTLKTDCFVKSMEKAAQRAKFVKKLKDAQ